MSYNTESCDDTFSNLRCCICHNYLAQAYTLNCSHSFCFDCIAEWRDHHAFCPVCEEDIYLMTPNHYLNDLVTSAVGGATAEAVPEQNNSWFDWANSYDPDAEYIEYSNYVQDEQFDLYNDEENELENYNPDFQDNHVEEEDISDAEDEVVENNEEYRITWNYDNMIPNDDCWNNN